MSKFKDKFRVETTRLQYWDYSQSWLYYITICTHNHTHHFGSVCRGKMDLNQLGKAAEQFWLNIPGHYSNAELDKWVIMPNHIHGIIIINNAAETRHASSLQHKNITIADIIGSYKSAVTKYSHENGFANFKWQPRFYDRIIRDEIELLNVRDYISQNPNRWNLAKNDFQNIGF